MFFKSLLFLLATLKLSSLAQDTSLHDWLIEGEGWKPAISGYSFTDGLCTDAAGNLYFSDVKMGKGIYKHDVKTTQTALLYDGLPGISGMQFGSDGKLYACHNKAQRIICIDAAGTVEELLTGVKCNDLVVTKLGYLYFTETATKRIHCIHTSDKNHWIVDEGHVTKPNGISLSPDQQTLAVSDHGGKHIWTWRIEQDGSLSAAEPYMALELPLAAEQSKDKAELLPSYNPNSLGDGMTTEAQGRYFVTSAVGVQVFDTFGRHSGTLALPKAGAKIVSVEFAGADHDILFLAAGDTIWSRKLKVKGLW